MTLKNINVLVLLFFLIINTIKGDCEACCEDCCNDCSKKESENSKENESNKYYRFCICVSKKLGNAVVRNKNKRQIKDIIDKSNLSFKRDMDYVIILRKDITSLTYDQKRDELLSILK